MTIAFTLQQGTGTIADASRTTDANGEASTTVTLGHVATDVVIQATWADAPEGAISTVQFHLHATPDVPSTWVVVSGANQCVLTNTTYPTPIVFRLTDQYGNPIPSVPVRLTPSNGTIAGLSLNQQLETQTDLDGKVSVSLSAGNASFANPAGDPVHITATYIPTPTLSTTVNLIASQASYLIPSPPDASLQAAKDFWIGGVYVVHYYTMGVYLYQLCGVPASGVNVTFENWNASPNPLPHTYTVVTNASGYAGRTYNNGNFDFIDQYNSTVKASAANYGYSGYNSWIILHWQN
jgi:hypothetical protein